MSSRVGVIFEGSAGSVVAASREAAAAVQGVSKSVSASTVETVKSSSAFKGLAKSVALTSAAFLGGAGLIAVVKESIGQAETLQKAHASLDVSVTRLGGNFKIASGEIDTWAAKQAKFGVTITASEQGLARLIPLTGSVTTAMKTYSEALELSKGDNIDLSAAETAVAKANDGKTTSLQRYGIVLAKNASQEQIAAAISKRFGGQAAANTTTLDQLKATLGNVGLTLGQDMLPQIEHLTGGLEGWFSNQQNVNRVTSDAKQVIDDTVTVIQTTYNWAEKITGALGGWKDSLELIGAAWAAVKIAGWVTSLARLTTALFGVRDAEVAVNAANPFAALAVAAGLAATEIIQHWKQVNDVINGTPGQSPQYTTPAQNAYSKGGKSVFQANGVYYQRTQGSAYPTVINKSAYDAFVNQPGVTLNNTLIHPGAVSPAKVQGYLVAAGLPAAAAAVLAGIDVHGENATGNLTAMNVNKNGTYDYGLFQINSSHKPSTMTDAQWKAYLANPANNAKEAAGILTSQGFGAWTEKYGAAAAKEYPKGSAAWNLLMSGGFGGSIPPPAGGGTTKKPKIVSGAALVPSALNDQISQLADQAKNAVGAAVVAELQDERADVEKAIADVSAKLKGASPKETAAINSELSTLTNKARDLKAAITDAIASKDEQATIAKFTTQLKAEQAENKRLTDQASLDATYSIKTSLGSATQAILDDYQSIGQNLVSQTNTLTTEKGKLVTQLAGAGVKTSAYIKSHISTINTELGNVATAIQTNLKSEADELQQTVNTIASQVSSKWSSVSSDIVSEFEQQTNDYVNNVLGPQYFQGGLQTPLESQLAQMQQQDQLTSLQQNLAAASTPADQQAAQRALDEYNLSIEAAAERAQADKEYAAAVQTYTDQRTVEEHKLSIALDAFGQGLADNKGNLSDLSDLLAQYGIPTMAGLSDVAGQLYAIDFPALSKSVGNLQAATDALTTIEWQLYGKMGGTGGGGGSDAPPAPAGSYSVGGGYTPYIQRALPGLPVALAGGGTIRVPGRFIGRDSVPALLSPGETVIDRSLTAALHQLVAGGPSGGVTVNATVLGATEGQVGSALERLTTPAGKRVVSYNAPRL